MCRTMCFCMCSGSSLAGPCQNPKERTLNWPATILFMPCGEEGVKRHELLPGDVVTAEKEALQAGQAVHLSLERERGRGRTE